MALTYSLKYKKLHFSHKVLLEKEGEIVIDRQSFRLRGKGAQDQGEVIYFGDIKDVVVRADQLSFRTYNQEKYLLSDFSNLFDVFLRDFLRVRNEYLAEKLFMKVGMLMGEFEGSVEVMNANGKLIPQGKAKIQCYEGSIVIMPETRTAFVVYLNFLKHFEVDSEDYMLRLLMDKGDQVHISQLGTSFEDAQEVIESLMGKMYEKVVNGLTEFFPEFNAQVLLKLAYKVKGGRFVNLKTLKKMDKELAATIEERLVADNPELKEKIDQLRSLNNDDEHFFVSLSFGKHQTSGDSFLRIWFLQVLPKQNVLCLGQSSGSGAENVHLFRVVMQQGAVEERFPAKILEIDQMLMLFHFDLSPVWKDRRELRKSKYGIALKKLSFLRMLRKSYLGAHSGALSQEEIERLAAIDLRS